MSLRTKRLLAFAGMVLTAIALSYLLGKALGLPLVATAVSAALLVFVIALESLLAIREGRALEEWLVRQDEALEAKLPSAKPTPATSTGAVAMAFFPVPGFAGHFACLLDGHRRTE
jgi:small neutral amino acid transporter SnatA (MarC family)